MTSRRIHALVLAAALALSAGAGAELNCNVGIDFYSEGGVRGCVLNGNHRIYTERGIAVVCADGARLEQHPDGSLARCTLAEAVRLDGQDCAARFEVRFRADGSLQECLAPRAD